MTAQTAAVERLETGAKSDSTRLIARGSEYLPATFEDRGVAISFTTPKLNQARLRRNERQGLELLVPDFADSGATYVMPWPLLPELVSMTLHDRELHKLITAKPALTPWEMRRLQMEIGARGLAGPAAAAACRQALGEDDRLRLAANFALIQKVFGFLGFATEELKAANFLTVETQTHVRRAFQALGKEIGASPEQCYGAIAEQSASLAQIGVPGADQPGRLRRILDEMRFLIGSVDRWSTTAYSEHQGRANMVARVAEHTVMMADYDLDRLDRRISDIARFVKDWEREAQEVRRLASRLSWLLDGWDHIAAAWRSAIGNSEADTTDALTDIERVLPRVPRKEVEHIPQLAESAAKLNGGRRVAAMQDWRSKSRDSDLIRRLEQVKGATQ